MSECVCEREREREREREERASFLGRSPFNSPLQFPGLDFPAGFVVQEFKKELPV